MIPRFKILQRDRFRCRYCGADPGVSKLHIDHIHPKSKGGTDHHLNLVTACASCNCGKRDSLPDWEPCSPMFSGPDGFSFIPDDYLGEDMYCATEADMEVITGIAESRGTPYPAQREYKCL